MRIAAALLAIIATGVATAQPAAPVPIEPETARWFSVPPNAVFGTGDSWTVGSRTFRLFGVQSCLRGTSFTNRQGAKRDCGEASLAMLVALIRDLRPSCYGAAELPSTRTTLVICVAQPGSGRGAGSRIDLGTALIASGFAFAVRDPDGRPVHPPYLVAQQVAMASRAGLWAFADTPDPTGIIRRALADRAQDGSEPRTETRAP